MGLTFDPRTPLHWVALAIAIATGLVLVAAVLLPSHRSMLGRAWPARATVTLCSILSAALLALAAWNPILVGKQAPEHMHLSVVLDISPSAISAKGGWSGVVGQAGQILDGLIDRIPADVRTHASASIVVFRNQAAVFRPAPETLDDLPKRVRQVPEDEIPGDGSNLAAGLQRAGEQITASGGRGAIILVSDGLQTEGDALQAAQDLARRGVPIYVVPLFSEGAEVALIAADLPRQTYAGDPILLRGTLMNRRAAVTPVSLTITLNDNLKDGSPRVGAAAGSTPITQTLAANSPQPLRSKVEFAGGHGLQFLDLTLTFDDGRGRQRRRFFTNVKRPIKILAVGGDQRWQAAFPEGTANITSARAGNLAVAGDLRGYDVVVLSAVAAQDFAPSELQRIATAVDNDGVGLMLINGDHGGASEEAGTILKSYNDSPIEPLLPVISGPRPFLAPPPSRHVIFLIDASGSMDGWPLEKAKEITANVIERLLRPADTIDIIAFNTEPLHLVKQMNMDQHGKEEAIKQLSTLTQGFGGTDPRLALQLIQNERDDECGLIYLTDGGFDVVSQRPECRATAFAIGGNITPALAQLADPFPVGPDFNPENITIPYFEPEKRTKLWEAGSFSPLRISTAERAPSPLPVPSEPLLGSAISYLRDQASELVALRPKLRDPILAYRPSGAGYVGVFTSAFNEAWLRGENTRRAIEQWITRLAPYSDRERYDFTVRDDGTRIFLRVALVAQEGNLPDVQTMQMHIQHAGQDPVELPVVADPGSPATFTTEITLPRGETAQETTLILEERGPDALPRPQRIPLILPAKGDVTQTVTTEAYSFGTNRDLLGEIATESGGRWLDEDPGAPLFNSAANMQDRTPLWPFIIVAAGLSYLAAILVRRLGL